MTYAGLSLVEDDHLGGNVRHGDPHTFAPLTWRYLLERFCPQSLLDVGAGQGHCAHWFAKRGVHVVAMDGARENVSDALYPTVLHDLVLGPFVCPVDLVYAQETVEHVDEAHIGNLVRTLANGEVVAMTHALPGQGGYHHVNCREDRYWVEIMAEAGFSLSEADTKRVRSFGELYFERSGLVFLKEK